MSSLPQRLEWVAIVDDDESIRRSLSRIFLLNGIHVRTFSSAEDYLSRISTGKPCCMVLDVHLTGLTGFELQDRLRLEGRVPPIVFITALAEIPAEHIETRSGNSGFLRKPFDIQALLDLVRPHVT